MKISKLNPNAQKWVDALRSGKYKQGTDCLGTVETGLCCLGVLGVVAEIPFDSQKGSLRAYPEIKQWAGLKSSWGEFGEDCLTKRNDSGETFSRIADLIEEHAEELGVAAEAL